MRIVCWQTIHMHYHTLFLPKIGENIAKFVVCCSCVGALRVKNVKHCIFFVQDYMLLVPANQYSPQDINLLPIDNIVFSLSRITCCWYLPTSTVHRTSTSCPLITPEVSLRTVLMRDIKSGWLMSQGPRTVLMNHCP